MLAILGLCWWDVGPFMLKTSSETTFYDFFRPSKQKLWKNQRFLTSPRCNSAPPKGPKPCKKWCFWTQGAKSTVNYRYFGNIVLCTMFFSFLAVFPLPESYQNDPKLHFNTLLRSDTQKSSKKVENTTIGWSRCETVFGVRSRCEIVFAPPPS